MERSTIFQLLAAANLQRGVTLHVTEPRRAQALLRLAAAGVVDIYLHGERAERGLTVRRVTAHGKRLLLAYARERAAEPVCGPPSARPTVSQDEAIAAAVVESGWAQALIVPWDGFPL